MQHISKLEPSSITGEIYWPTDPMVTLERAITTIGSRITELEDRPLSDSAETFQERDRYFEASQLLQQVACNLLLRPGRRDDVVQVDAESIINVALSAVDQVSKACPKMEDYFCAVFDKVYGNDPEAVNRLRQKEKSAFEDAGKSIEAALGLQS